MHSTCKTDFWYSSSVYVQLSSLLFPLVYFFHLRSAIFSFSSFWHTSAVYEQISSLPLPLPLPIRLSSTFSYLLFLFSLVYFVRLRAAIFSSPSPYCKYVRAHTHTTHLDLIGNLQV